MDKRELRLTLTVTVPEGTEDNTVLDALNEALDETNRNWWGDWFVGALSVEPNIITGADVTEGASDVEAYCGCGEPITEYDGAWLHIYNPELRGTDDHDASPE